VRYVLVVRCANGVVVWSPRKNADRTVSWVCLRDNFVVAQAGSLAGVEQQLSAMAQHSVALSGAIQQVVELQV